MSAIGMSTLGVWCDTPSVGMSTLGVWCDTVVAPGIGDVFDPTLMTLPPDEVIRVLKDRAILAALIARKVDAASAARSLSKTDTRTMRSATTKRTMAVDKTERTTQSDQKRKKVHVIINGLIVDAELTQDDLLVLLEAAELTKSGKLN